MLSNKNKQRLNQLATVIFSTEEVMDNMSDINKEYSLELEKAIALCQGKKVEEPSSLSTSLSLQYDKFQIPEFGNNNKQQSSNSQPPPSDTPGESPSPKESEPAWVKKLWRKIMQKCHPDKLSFDVMSAQEISRRQIYLQKSQEAIETKNWEELLYIGVRLNEYIEEMHGKKQIQMLNDHYSNITNKIATTQKSIAWSWGSNWDNLASRVKILESVLILNKIPVPPKTRMLQILVEIEEM